MMGPYEIRMKLVRETLLAFPRRGATIALMTNASDKVMEAVLQQRIETNCQLLGLFLRKFTAI